MKFTVSVMLLNYFLIQLIIIENDKMNYLKNI